MYTFRIIGDGEVVAKVNALTYGAGFAEIVPYVMQYYKDSSTLRVEYKEPGKKHYRLLIKRVIPSAETTKKT